MVDYKHVYLIKELENCNKKETTYIIISIILSFLELILNLVFARNPEDFSRYSANKIELYIFFASMAFTFIINTILLIILHNNNTNRNNVRIRLSSFDTDSENNVLNSPVLTEKQNIWPILLILALTIFVTLLPILSVME